MSNNSFQNYTFKLYFSKLYYSELYCASSKRCVFITPKKNYVKNPKITNIARIANSVPFTALGLLLIIVKVKFWSGHVSSSHFVFVLITLIKCLKGQKSLSRVAL